jgi:nitroimidazol reductase NimA-like FMN-containing flavoprotein (pyridoxamine 5'-phosphate oxidase superfamily)
MSAFTMSAQERVDFLADIHVAILAVERDDASPLAVPVWYGVGADGDVLVWTERGTRKERLIRASGRFTLSVQNEALRMGM